DQCHDAGTCDPATGACSNPPLTSGTPCEDGDACTENDVCDDGSCLPGMPVNFDDQNPCTADSCDAMSGVQHTPVAEGTPCGDGNACNGEELCDGTGVCQAGTALTCDDGNACNGVENCVP